MRLHSAVVSLLLFAFAAADNDFPLNVGIVTKNGDVTSANVMQKGTSTSHDSWDPSPFADLSTWDSPAVEFGVWIANVGGVPKDATLTVVATTKAPGGLNTNYAQCGEPSVSQKSNTVHMITETGSVNATAVRVVVNPNPNGSNCAQPGQTEVYVTFKVTTSDGKQWKELPSQYFVYTHGNPLDISSTAQGDAKDIASQGTATANWSPGSSAPHTVGSHVDTMTVYLQVPASRGQKGSNPLVLGGEQGVHLVGTDIDRAKVKCTAGKIGKACSAIVQSTSMPNTDGTWESQDVVVAGNVFSLTIAYGCQTNGYVDLEVEIPLSSGFAPVTFGWRKACAKTPGLQVATSFDAVVGSPDVASDGTARVGWGPDFTNTSHVDGYNSPHFSLYFFVQNQANVKPAYFSSATLNSTKHPAKGASDLECLPTVAWSKCTNFQAPKSGCTHWSAMTEVNPQTHVPSQPLGIVQAPIRATFDYSVCAGSGAVRLQYDLLFGQFDRLTLNWYKYNGHAPGFDISCANGCPSASDKTIVTSGAAQGKWTTDEGPRLSRTLLQSSWSLKANKAVSDYTYNIVGVTVTGSNRGCTLKHSGDLGKYFPGPDHRFIGPLAFTPGSEFSWNIVYFCSNADTRSTFEKVTITFEFEHDLFHPITITFTKDWYYQQFVNIGTSTASPTTRDDVSTRGSPVKGWDYPDGEAGRWTYCGLKKGQRVDPNHCAYDTRTQLSRSFFITNEGGWGDVTIPAPASASDSSSQYPGVHTTHFFNYNSSNMYHCNPWWDINMKRDGVTIIKNRDDFVKQGKAVVGTKDAVNLTIVYNCSSALTKCQEQGKCAAMFTGYIPITSAHCDANNPNTEVACSPPLFRWVKTVAPVKPFPTDLEWAPGKDSINVTWKVPVSGAGADELHRQLIKEYTVTVLREDDNAVIKTYVLPVDEAHPEYFKAAGELIDLNIDGLNATYYEIVMNTTNTAGKSRTQTANANTFIAPNDTGSQPWWETLLIASVVGVCLIVSACGMYHYCIKSSDSKDELKENLLTGNSAGVNTNTMASPVAAEPSSPDFYPPAVQSKTADEAAADDAMERLMRNA
jgi:hypothetical protein